MAPVNPAASAKGTVKPSAIPMTMSRTTSLDVKCRSMWGVWGMLHRIQKISRIYKIQSCKFCKSYKSCLKLTHQHQHTNHNKPRRRHSLHPHQRHVITNNTSDQNSQRRHRGKCETR